MDYAGVTPTALGTDAIIAVASAIIDAEGADALTLARVSSELDVTQPALYRHVEGISGLWRYLGLQTRADLARKLTEASVGHSSSDAVRAIATAWRTFGRENPGCYRSTERFAVAGDPELEQAVQRVIDVLVLALRGYRLGGDEAVHGARALRSALHGFVTFELGDGNPPPHDPDESFDAMITLLCLGFEAGVQRGNDERATSICDTKDEGGNE